MGLSLTSIDFSHRNPYRGSFRTVRPDPCRHSGVTSSRGRCSLAERRSGDLPHGTKTDQTRPYEGPEATA
jgi:hypothetical protein